MDLITVIGIAASICTATSLIPQLVKIVKERKAENVSMGMLAVLFAGLVLWIWYGVMKEDAVIIVSNATSLTINIALAILTLKYKKAH